MILELDQDEFDQFVSMLLRDPVNKPKLANRMATPAPFTD